MIFVRSPLRLTATAAAISLSLLAATPARAETPDTRVFGSATAAVLGGIVAGPIGLVAGAAIGYFLGPTLSRATVGPQRRVARRRIRNVPLAAAPSQPYPQQGYMQQGYAPQPGQPMYLAQQQTVPMQVGPVPSPQGQATYPTQTMPNAAPQSQAYPAVSPGIAQRPVMYAPVPVPMALAPGGNYAARAYQPQEGGQTADPLH